MTRKIALLTIFVFIFIQLLIFINTVDASDESTLEQGIAFVANQPFGAYGLGHVAVGFQTFNGHIIFLSLGPGTNGAKVDIETKIYSQWADVEERLSNDNLQYTKIKIIQVDNPNATAALIEMNKPEKYNLLASTIWNQETEVNCLTYTINILTAYGVKDLAASPPTEAPNMYFAAYIPGKEYDWDPNLNRYSDNEGNTINVDNIAPENPNAEEESTIEGLGAITFYDSELGGHSVNSISFSPDGSKLATAGFGVQIWDVASGLELQELALNENLFSVSFSPDGSKLATDSSTAQIWDVDSGAELQRLVHNNSTVSSVSFSPDGSKLATVSSSQYRTVRIWDVDSGAELQRLVHDSDVEPSVSFSPDGSKLATASYNARIWDVASGVELPELVHDAFVKSVSFSSDGSKLATGSYDGNARIWDVDSGAELQRLVLYNDVNSVSFSPDGSKLATASYDAQIWDVDSGAELQRLVHNSTVNSVSFSPDGSKLATGSNYGIRIWDVSS